MAEGLSGGVICRGGSGSSLVGRGGRVDASGEESAGSDGAGESTVYLQETESVDLVYSNRGKTVSTPRVAAGQLFVPKSKRKMACNLLVSTIRGGH
jgi:hypothetical protein